MATAAKRTNVKRNINLLYWFNFLIVSLAGSVVFAFAAYLIGTMADDYGARAAMLVAILIQAMVIPIYIILFRTSD